MNRSVKNKKWFLKYLEQKQELIEKINNNKIHIK